MPKQEWSFLCETACKLSQNATTSTARAYTHTHTRRERQRGSSLMINKRQRLYYPGSCLCSQLVCCLSDCKSSHSNGLGLAYYQKAFFTRDVLTSQGSKCFTASETRIAPLSSTMAARMLRECEQMREEDSGPDCSPIMGEACQGPLGTRVLINALSDGVSTALRHEWREERETKGFPITSNMCHSLVVKEITFIHIFFSPPHCGSDSLLLLLRCPHPPPDSHHLPPWPMNY